MLFIHNVLLFIMLCIIYASIVFIISIIVFIIIINHHHHYISNSAIAPLSLLLFSKRRERNSEESTRKQINIIITSRSCQNGPLTSPWERWFDITIYSASSSLGVMASLGYQKRDTAREKFSSQFLRLVSTLSSWGSVLAPVPHSD